MAVEEDREPALSQASMPAGAVFLSYASQDAAAAEQIAMALRNAGIQVWFDKSELRGGDAWDRQIRQQIHDCRLFTPIISAHTEARDEGYFRREWRLAIERAGDMAEKKAFLVPVVVDGTSERGASVPEKFREVQWTRLPGGEASPVFVQRVRNLLSPEPAATGATPTPPSGSAAVLTPNRLVRSHGRSKLVVWAIGAVLAFGLAYLTADRLWIANHSKAGPPAEKAASSTSSPPTTVAPFNPPPHSIAVLPFVNMSGDKDQEYFSDGLTEELLNSLSRIGELQVAARTSSFSFQGGHPDITTVAHKLNVASVLEGSVRRSGHTIRVTAQLNNAVTGFHLWSQTYDRDLGDLLKLQTDIATAVTTALKVALLGDETAKFEVGGTHNPAAFDAYLRAAKTYAYAREGSDIEAAIAGYTGATHLDPDYALAYAARSIAAASFAKDWATTTPQVRAGYAKAQADALKAIALAPELSEGHIALALVYQGLLEFTPASQEYERARAFAPGSTRVLWNYGTFEVLMGHSDSGLTALRRAVAVDPLNPQSHMWLGRGLAYLRRYTEAIAAFRDARALNPARPDLGSVPMGMAYYLLGDLERARASCEIEAAIQDTGPQHCLAMTYDKMGRHADAETMLAKVRAIDGDPGALEYSQIYAQWGNTEKALEWLGTSLRLRDPGLAKLKADPLLDPLRNEPRFQAVERALKFPD